jgi:bla regulator protein blaR1
MSLMTHLWQSTLCVGVAALLTVVLRRASARTRHAIWHAASLKFLVPFSLLVMAGSVAGAWTSSFATPDVSVAVRWLDQSLSIWNLDVLSAAPAGGRFLPGVGSTLFLMLVAVWASGLIGLGAWRYGQWRAVSRLARDAARLEYGREVEALRRAARTASRPRRVELLLCASSFEPGVIGVIRPRLLWPEGLSDRLTDGELDAVIAHEVCHVDRRDNLSAILHVAVETLFWFHPLVWWLSARLLSERERACDEEVLRLGCDGGSYAEGILKVCGFCLRPEPAFVAGVGGSNLVQRIEWIMTRPVAASLSLPARLLLAGVIFLTAAAPFATGVLSAHRETRVALTTAEPTPLQPAAEQGDRKTYKPGEGGVTVPKLVKELKPRYTKAAMMARIQGSLTLEAVVLESGAVGDVKVIRSLDAVHGLDDEAVKTLKQWQFEPGTKDKKPVPVRIEVEMTFKLK